MGDRKFAIKILEDKGEVIIKAAGNSMRPIMATGETLYLKKVAPSKLRVGDAVFCKIKSGLMVHKIHAINKQERFTIANNTGHINGTIGAQSIYGLCVQVEDRILVSNEEIEQR